jgi:hypothetical protein
VRRGHPPACAARASTLLPSCTRRRGPGARPRRPRATAQRAAERGPHPPHLLVVPNLVVNCCFYPRPDTGAGGSKVQTRDWQAPALAAGWGCGRGCPTAARAAAPPRLPTVLGPAGAARGCAPVPCDGWLAPSQVTRGPWGRALPGGPPLPSPWGGRPCLPPATQRRRRLSARCRCRAWSGSRTGWRPVGCQPPSRRSRGACSGRGAGQLLGRCLQAGPLRG